MKRVAILLAASLLLSPPGGLVATAAGGVCAPPVDYALLTDEGSSGIGGTGRATPPETGIGGTGRAVPGDSGIGGTGHADAPGGGDGGIGGTGIVGTITGFASICVNGLEVHYDDNVPVSDNGQPTHARGLAVGQVVAVEAGSSPRGLEARRIAVLHALVGPVTRSLDQHGQLEVMGAKVALDPPQLQDQARALKAGDWVKVSGHPGAEHGVVASHIARIDAGGEASVSGRADPEGRRVGAVAVDRAASGQLTVRGNWDGQRLMVRDSRPADGTVWSGRPAQVVIETRVSQRDGASIRTGRADVDAVLAERRGRDADALSEGTLLRVTARLDADGKLRPLRIERAQRQEQRHSRSDNTDNSTDQDDNKGGAGTDDASKGRDDRRGRDDQDRDAKEARKALEKSPKENERSERSPRDERDAADRNADRERLERAEKLERSEKADRVDRPERNERPERTERSGRDH
ncbi:MAG TPA: DUF5666 domain-containing protein [Rhodocyclaceae bacterium]|nr:DUF5666 domain-containing protein [Rhodocyclaceae bacterium]